MSIEDRDWYRESYHEREEKYGGDFSLHSKAKKRRKKSFDHKNISFNRKKSDNRKNTYSDYSENEFDDEYPGDQDYWLCL